MACSEDRLLDSEQSLFCSKIPAGGAARKRVRYSSREPRAASSVGGRVGEERKERLPCFHTAFLKPGTLVTEYFDWSVYDPMAGICHHHLETCGARQRLPSIELLTARHQTHSFKRSYSHIWLKPSSAIYYTLHSSKEATTLISWRNGSIDHTPWCETQHPATDFLRQ